MNFFAAPILPAAIVNLIGEEGYTGEAYYEGLEEVLKLDNAFVHLYGKKTTKPGRKMGLVTIMHKDYIDITHNGNKLKHTLRVKTVDGRPNKIKSCSTNKILLSQRLLSKPVCIHHVFTANF